MTTIDQNPKSPTGNPSPPGTAGNPPPIIPCDEKPKGFPRGKTPREVTDAQLEEYRKEQGAKDKPAREDL